MKRRHSLFFKLLFIYGATFLSVLFLVLVVRKISSEKDPSHPFKTHVNQYANYLMEDIGLPPDKEKALHLGEKLGLEMRFVGPQYDWSTDSKMNEIDLGEDNRLLRPHVRGWESTIGDWRVFFQASKPPFLEFYWWIFLAGLFLILVLSYHLVKKIFHPLIEVKKVADSIASGDYGQRTEGRKHGEFAQLGDSINQMAEKIQQKMEAMNELLLAVSHEFRSPLTRIRVATEFIDSEKIKKTIVGEVEELNALTSHLLENERVRQQPLNLSTLPLTPWLSDLFARLEVPADLSDIGEISVDKERLEIAIKNLVTNSKRYSQGVKARCSQTEKNIEIIIADDGPGPSAEIIRQIGKPFLRKEAARDKQSGGFGLGLYLCSSIVKAHGGELTFSILENSCEAKVQLPLRRQP